MAKFEQLEDTALMDLILSESKADDTWVFDCDGTLINSDISTFTGWALIRSGLANPELLPKPWVEGNKGTKIDFKEFEAMYDHIVNERGVTGAYKWEIELQSGLSPEMVIDIASGVLEDALKTGQIRYTRHVSKLAEKVAKQAWVVSGSSHPTVSAITARLGIPPERVLATSLEVVDGLYERNFKDPGIIWEETKRSILREHKIHTPYFVAGDTIGDWHMMQMAREWCWCVIWDDFRHRGLEWRDYLQKNLFKDIQIPMQAGFYKIEHAGKKWAIEIKGDFS